MADSSTRTEAKGKSVPSRYKQAAESFICRSTENTLSTTTQPNTTKQLKYSSNSTDLKTTAYKKKTSTPTTCNKEEINFDFSSILETPGMPEIPAPLLAMTSTINRKKIANSTRPGKQKKVATSHSKEHMDADIDIHYAQYQLALLLRNKAIRSFQEKCKTAMRKIDGALCYIKVLLAEHADIKKANDLVSFTIKCHEHLKTQEDISVPLMNLLENVNSRYEEIAIAIDNVRHKLCIENVPIPEPDEEDEIIEAVHNVNSLLDQILSSINSEEDVTHSSKDVCSFVTKAQQLKDDIKRGTEMLAESRDLLLTETSQQLASRILED